MAQPTIPTHKGHSTKNSVTLQRVFSLFYDYSAHHFNSQGTQHKEFCNTTESFLFVLWWLSLPFLLTRTFLRKLVAKSSVVPQRPLWLRDWWWWWWCTLPVKQIKQFFYQQVEFIPCFLCTQNWVRGKQFYFTCSDFDQSTCDVHTSTEVTPKAQGVTFWSRGGQGSFVLVLIAHRCDWVSTPIIRSCHARKFTYNLSIWFTTQWAISTGYGPADLVWHV